VREITADFHSLSMDFDGRIELRFGTASNLTAKIEFADHVLRNITPEGTGQVFVYDTREAVVLLDNKEDYIE